MRTERRKLAVIAGVVSLLLVGLVVNASAHGGDTGKVHGCVARDSRLLRVVEATEACRSNETAIDWNIEGVPGPQGPRGEPGGAGPEGPPGPAGGLSGMERVSMVVYSSPVSNFDDRFEKASDAVVCPDGKYVISGGYSYSGSSFTLRDGATAFVVKSQGPEGSDAEGRPTRWGVEIDGYPSFSVLIWAFCAAA